jgi:hypothetical protein
MKSMNQSSNRTVIPTHTGEQKPSWLTVINIDDIKNQLKAIEEAINAIKIWLNGNPYGGFIRCISHAEELIQEKKMKDGQIAIRILQELIKIWKEFIGSELVRLLDSSIIEDRWRYEKKYGMIDTEIRDNTDNIEICTLERIREIMETNVVLGIKTQSGIKFDSTKSIPERPSNNDSQKVLDIISGNNKLDNTSKSIALGAITIIVGKFTTQWPVDAKWTIPELLTVVKIMNLMITKIELLSKLVILSGLATLNIDVEQIINKR